MQTAWSIDRVNSTVCMKLIHLCHFSFSYCFAMFISFQFYKLYDLLLTGQKEIWDALKAAATATETGDNALAQAIIDGANISLPHGKKF